VHPEQEHQLPEVIAALEPAHVSACIAERADVGSPASSVQAAQHVHPLR